VPALLSLLDALPADSPFGQLHPPQRRQRTLDALKRVLLRESQVQPLLLVCEDLHWIDFETQALLESLVESLPTARILLLVNYRPEYQHGWGSKTFYTQVRLDPLPPARADELLQALMGTDTSLAALTPLLIARTEGNPFFLEESVQTLVETQVLLGERGDYHLAHPLASLQVPATVQAVLAARIDRLPAAAKALLQTAQRDTQAQAIDLRLARRRALGPSGDLGRVLALLSEAEALAVDLDDPRRLGQVCVSLSNYFWIRGAHDEAIAAAQRALVFASAGGEVSLHALAHLRLGQAYHGQGDYRRAVDCFAQAAAFFDGARRHERFGLDVLPAAGSRAWLAACHAELGRFREGIALGEAGLRIAETDDHPAGLMVALWGVGLLALRHGDVPRALPLLERAVGMGRDADLPLFFLRIAPALGVAYTLAGRIADAVPLLTQALERACAMAWASYEAHCRLSLGAAQMLAGRLEEAQGLAERTLALVRAHQERGHQAYALHLLGEIAARHAPLDSEHAEAS